MKDLFWNIFEKSGNIDAFMAYKEFKCNKTKNNNIDDNNIIDKKNKQTFGD